MAISRSLQPRQQYGLGSFVKKAFKKVKKIAKSPLGKAALLGAGAWFAPTMWGGQAGLGGWKTGLGALRNRALGTFATDAARAKAGSAMRNPSLLSKAWGGLKDFGLGKAAFLGAGLGATVLPFMGGDEDETVDTSEWWQTPDSIKNIHKMAKDRHADLKFLPSSIYAAPGYYNMAQGGVASLANGGEAGQAQAEQMLRMEYQKYRNQGGTMSYQQFKMAILQQAQGQGPMAQPQMAAYGGRMGYQGGEMVEGIKEGISTGVDESVFIRTIKYLMNEHGLSKEEAFERVLPKFRKNIDPGFAPIRPIGGGRNIDPGFAPLEGVGGGRNIDPGFERLEDIDIEGIETLRGRR